MNSGIYKEPLLDGVWITQSKGSSLGEADAAWCYDYYNHLFNQQYSKPHVLVFQDI